MIYVVLVPFFFQSKDANKLLFSATIVIPAVFFFYQIKETGKQSKATGLVLCQRGERIFGNKR